MLPTENSFKGPTVGERDGKAELGRKPASCQLSDCFPNWVTMVSALLPVHSTSTLLMPRPPSKQGQCTRTLLD